MKISAKVIKRISYIVLTLLVLLVVGGYFAMDMMTSYVLKSIAGDSLQAIEDAASQAPVGETESDVKDASGEFVYKAEVSPGKAKAVEESISLSEKLKITTTLLPKLGPSEINLFIEMLGNGMDTDEKKEARRIILKKLSEEEYNELISIAEKYGLSEGRTYEETLKIVNSESRE